jgi:predicted extracellular nuclease
MNNKLLIGSLLMLLVLSTSVRADEDDDPNERIAIRLTDTNRNGLAAVVVGRLLKADPTKTYQITVTLAGNGGTVATFGPQDVSAANPNVTIDQPGGARFNAVLDTDRRNLKATYRLVNLTFDVTYTGTVLIREGTGLSSPLRLSGNASATLEAPAAPPPVPTDPCVSVTGYTSVCRIQFTTAANGASPVVGMVVTTRGVVSGVIQGSSPLAPQFFIQDGPGRWNGVWVRATSPIIDEAGAPATLSIGSQVEVSGVVTEFGGGTEVDNAQVVVLNLPSGSVLATPVTTIEADDESYEGVLVSLLGATLGAPLPPPLILVSDASGELAANFVQNSVPVPLAGATFNLTGILHANIAPLRFVMPRGASDVN